MFVRERLSRIRERLQPVDRRNSRKNHFVSDEKSRQDDAKPSVRGTERSSATGSRAYANSASIRSYNSQATSIRSGNHLAKCLLDPAIEKILDGGDVFVPDDALEPVTDVTHLSGKIVEVVVPTANDLRATEAVVCSDVVDLSFEVPKLSVVHSDVENLNILANSKVVHSKENPIFEKPLDSLPSLVDFFDPLSAIPATSSNSMTDGGIAVQNLLFDFDFQPSHTSYRPVLPTVPSIFEQLCNVGDNKSSFKNESMQCTVFAAPGTSGATGTSDTSGKIARLPQISLNESQKIYSVVIENLNGQLLNREKFLVICQQLLIKDFDQIMSFDSVRGMGKFR